MYDFNFFAFIIDYVFDEQLNKYIRVSNNQIKHKNKEVTKKS